MRTQSICLALAIVLFCPISSAQWVKQESGTTRNLYGVYFTDTNTGTVVGDSGTILRTTNGGATWTRQQCGTTQALRGVSIADAFNGTVVGDSGVILRTTNGGATWMPQASGSSLSLCGVCFTDATNGTVVGGEDPLAGGLILHTTNGGVIWTKQFETDSASLRSVSFSDGNTGTVVGGYWDDVVGGWNIIIRTNDGGSTWKTQTGTQAGFGSDILNSVFFTDSSTGTAVGGIWGSGDIPYNSYLIVRTTDGGAEWAVQKKVTRAGNGFNCVFFTDADTGTAVGCLGYCSNDPRLDNILHTTDGGATWTPQSSGTTNTLWGVCFTDANTGTAVGSRGTILHTTNGGVTSVGSEQQVPSQVTLSQNYPNPFNPSTTIKYELPKASQVNLSVFDILGREVSVLVNERKNAGVHEVKCDASSLPSGVYFCRLQAGDFTQTKRLLLLK